MSGDNLKIFNVLPHWCQEGPPGPKKKSESGILIQENWTPYLQMPNVQFLCNNWALLPITCHQPLVIRYLHHIRLIFVSILSIVHFNFQRSIVCHDSFFGQIFSTFCIRLLSNVSLFCYFLSLVWSGNKEGSSRATAQRLKAILSVFTIFHNQTIIIQLQWLCQPCLFGWV